MSLFSGLRREIIALSRRGKQTLALSVDLVSCALSVSSAFWVRLDEWISPVGNQWLPYILAVVLSVPIFISFGLYRAIFRYAGTGALRAIAVACTAYGICYALIFTMLGIDDVPRTVGVLQPLFLFLLVTASRLTTQHLLGGPVVLPISGERPRALIYGAGRAGRQLAAAFAGRSELEVIGFVDDDPRLHGYVLNGLQIFSSDSLHDLVPALGVKHVLLAIPSSTRGRRNQIVDALVGTGAQIRILPDLHDLANGRVEISDLRELRVDDLLGRDPVEPDQGLMESCIRAKTVLITGAGGSIGSELCRQALVTRPNALVLVESSEFALYEIHRELSERARSAGLSVTLVPLLASVTDPVRMNAIMREWLPDTIYHAAAYKHVPLVEANCVEGVRNNVLGTLVTARAAEQAGVTKFVLVSTDKAVRPTSVMGTSKRLAEMVLQAFAQNGSSTCFSIVRFGNVLGSSGSVVPLFRKQIRAGGPVTITDAEMTRFFMTIPEASQLVIQAGAMATGGEVFVLDMGEPVKIIDLARKMIELSGLTVRDADHPHGEIEIECIGLRPGEKLYEELLIGRNPVQTMHPRIMKAHEPIMPWKTLAAELEALDGVIANQDDLAVRELLVRLVPEYVGWVQRAGDAPEAPGDQSARTAETIAR